MPSDKLSKHDVEYALTAEGFFVSSEIDGLTIYSTHICPGGDIPLDWSVDGITREDLIFALTEENVDVDPVMNHLP